MSVVSTVASQVDKLRNRLFLARINGFEKVYLHTTRFTVSDGQSIERLRFSVLVRAKSVAEAELHAETRMKELVRAYVAPTTSDIALKTLKPRQLTMATLHDETEGIQQLLQAMRREAKRIVSFVERMESS